MVCLDTVGTEDVLKLHCTTKESSDTGSCSLTSDTRVLSVALAHCNLHFTLLYFIDPTWQQNISLKRMDFYNNKIHNTHI